MQYFHAIPCFAVLCSLMAFASVSSAAETARHFPGSVVEDGGTGRESGRVLKSVTRDGVRFVGESTRTSPLSTSGSSIDRPLLGNLPADTSLDLRWTDVSNKGETRPDLRWGRFTVPVDASQPVDFQAYQTLLLWVRKATDAPATLSVQLRDSAEKSGPRVRVDQHNLSLLETDASTVIAIPVSALAGAGDMSLSAVTQLVFEVAGETPADQLAGFYLDRAALTHAQRLPGIGRVGAVVVGDQLAITFEPRGGAEKVRLLSRGRMIGEASADDSQLVVDLTSAGDPESLEVQPLVADHAGKAQRVGPIKNTSSVKVTLAFAGPARSEPVSKYLMGTNGQEPETAAGQGVSLVRWGGNQTSTYNWKEDAWNSANDWYHLTGTRGDKPWTDPRTSRWYEFIKTLRDDDIDVYVSIPISDWVARRPKEGEPHGSYPAELYPQQQKFTADGKYGNGRTPDGKYIRMKDTTFTFRPNTPEFQRGWIEEMVKVFGTAEQGGVRFYGLDNEINLWHSSHFGSLWEGIDGPDLVRRNIEYAKMIKAVDPTAQVLGFAGWGQMGVHASDRDYRKGRWSDLPADQAMTERDQVRGGLDLVSWYLQEMRKAEEEHGQRLIDILSINWYPFLATVDPKTGKKLSIVDEKARRDVPYDPHYAEAQFDALRYWWDPTYTNEHSWTYQGTNKEKFWDPYTPVIPKLKAIIDTHYPGTKLAITEYALGSEEQMTGALLQVQSIGIFMDQDLWSAQRWFGTRKETWAYWGYALVGNWDGKRSGILGHYRPVSSDRPKIKAYATESGSRRHVVVVNEDYNTPATVSIPAEGASTYRVSMLSEPTGKQIVRFRSRPVAGQAVVVDVPAFSAVVCVIDQE